MEIVYKNKSIEKICNNPQKAQQKYGQDMTAKIFECMDYIRAADKVETLVQFHIGRCHALSQDRKGQYAMDLVNPFRLIFIVNKNGDQQIATIIEIVDYH